MTLDACIADRSLSSLPVLFHPESLVIETDHQRAQVLEWISEAQSSDGRAFSADEKRIIFLGQIYHERDHLRRTIATTHGMLLDATRSRFAAAFVKTFDEAAESSRSPCLPLIGALGSSTFGRSDALSPSQRSLVGADYANMAILESLGEESFDLAKDVIRECFDWSGDAISDFRLLPPFADFQGSGQPLIVNGRREVLSGKHLLELFAICEETNQVIPYLSSMERILSLHKELPYSFVLAAWQTQFGSCSIADPSDQPGAHGASGVLAFRMFPLEIFAAADLALWPPFRPPSGIRRQWRWVDVHPGARFLQTLAVLRDRRRPVTVIPATSAERTEALRSIQDDLCDELRWPTPATLTAEWLNYLGEKPVGHWPFLESPESFRWRSARQLLEMRALQAGDAVLNAFGELESDLPTEEALIVDGNERDLRRELLIEGRDDRARCTQFYLMNAMRQMTFNYPSQQLLVAFSKADRAAALASVAHYYAQRSSKYVSILRQECSTMLRL